MNPVYLRLLEIAEDLGEHPPVANTFFQSLLGLSSGRISQIADPLSVAKLGPKGLSALANLGFNPDWVNYGLPHRKRLSLSSDTKLASTGAEFERLNFEQAPGLRGRVPLISFVQAGDFVEVVDNFHPGDGEDWIDVTCPVNRHTFALRVVGDSMEPQFPAGMVIIVEPDMAAEPGNFVIAKNGDEATFKQLIRDGGDWYLKPVNPRYPIKPLGEARIIGVVRQATIVFR